MLMASRNYYTILGVRPEASTDDIRSRFKELARRLHPDRFPGEEKAKAEADFQEVTEAFNVLRDARRRRRHDVELAKPDRASERETLLNVYLQRGQKALRERSFAQAAESFQRATEVAPRNAKAWHLLALACSRSRRWRSQAVDAVNRACELEPLNVEYLKLGGRIHAWAGLPAKARKFYTEALQWGGSDPDVEEALKGLGRPD